MDVKLFAVVFGTIFVAELGDKTQLATLLYASEADNPKLATLLYASEADNPKLTVFAASALALVLTSAIGVLAGSAVSHYVSPKVVSWVAGIGFVAIGLGILLRA
jgi:putative Ca2+/H+ antiporter (TMEM165/GDT1 family)